MTTRFKYNTSTQGTKLVSMGKVYGGGFYVEVSGDYSNTVINRYETELEATKRYNTIKNRVNVDN